MKYRNVCKKETRKARLRRVRSCLRYGEILSISASLKKLSKKTV